MLAIVLVLTVATRAHAGWPLDEKEYEQTRDLAGELLGFYPPDKFALVFPGRSAGTLARYLNLVGDGLAHEFPLSNFRHQIPDTPLNRDVAQLRPFERESYRALSLAEEVKLFDHFDRVLPSDAALGGRTMVLVDYGSGDSLHALSVYVRRYLKTRKVKVATVALFDGRRARPAEEDGQFAASRFDRVVNLKKYPAVASSMAIHEPELYSVIGEWKLSQDRPGFVWNKNDFNLQSMERAMRDMFDADKASRSLRATVHVCRYASLGN